MSLWKKGKEAPITGRTGKETGKKRDKDSLHLCGKNKKIALVTGWTGKERRTRGKKGRRTGGRREKTKKAFVFVEKKKRSYYNGQDRKEE
jgi:hypothetical protein